MTVDKVVKTTLFTAAFWAPSSFDPTVRWRLAKEHLLSLSLVTCFPAGTSYGHFGQVVGFHLDAERAFVLSFCLESVI
jgi:hypothetical protein